jgi:hypothetical protein
MFFSDASLMFSSICFVLFMLMMDTIVAAMPLDKIIVIMLVTISANIKYKTSLSAGFILLKKYQFYFNLYLLA